MARARTDQHAHAVFEHRRDELLVALHVVAAELEPNSHRLVAVSPRETRGHTERRAYFVACEVRSDVRKVLRNPR